MIVFGFLIRFVGWGQWLFIPVPPYYMRRCMDINSTPTYLGIIIILALSILASTARPVPAPLGVYYTVFLSSVVITITETAFKGEWGMGLGLLLGSWLGVVTSGVGPVQAFISPFTWLLGPHTILLVLPLS